VGLRLTRVVAIGVVAAVLFATPSAAQGFRVLVFSKTAGFRHASIPDGIAMIQTLGAANGFTVDATEDASEFSTANLARYAVVVWLSTTGDVLSSTQETAFRDYVEGGGGWVGIHAAADTEYEWPWYGQLIGGNAWFASHPAQQTATLHVEDQTHESTVHYPANFSFFEEWYNVANNPRPSVNVLVTIDENTYSGGSMGADHPISWYHEVGEGRSWYTALGHRSETIADTGFCQHVLGGIRWAAGAAGDSSVSCTATPTDGCIAAERASVDIDERVAGKEKLKVALNTLSVATAQSDFGDPVAANTGYAICVYDHAGTLCGEHRVARARQLCGTKPCWRNSSMSGYKYGDKAAPADGIHKMLVRGGGAGKGRLQASGKNNMGKGMVALPVGHAADLAGSPQAFVRIVTTDAGCFAATLTEVSTADGVRFRASTR
jgi:type 1 glutamine amidotransferase